MDKCSFTDSKTLERRPSTLGTFLHIIMQVNLEVNKTTFSNGQSELGGAIYMSGCKN